MALPKHFEELTKHDLLVVAGFHPDPEVADKAGFMLLDFYLKTNDFDGILNMAGRYRSISTLYRTLPENVSHAAMQFLVDNTPAVVDFYVERDRDGYFYGLRDIANSRELCIVFREAFGDAFVQRVWKKDSHISDVLSDDLPPTARATAKQRMEAGFRAGFIKRAREVSPFFVAHTIHENGFSHAFVDAVMKEVNAYLSESIDAFQSGGRRDRYVIEHYVRIVNDKLLSKDVRNKAKKVISDDIDGIAEECIQCGDWKTLGAIADCKPLSKACKSMAKNAMDSAAAKVILLPVPDEPENIRKFLDTLLDIACDERLCEQTTRNIAALRFTLYYSTQTVVSVKALEHARHASLRPRFPVYAKDLIRSWIHSFLDNIYEAVPEQFTQFPNDLTLLRLACERADDQSSAPELRARWAGWAEGFGSIVVSGLSGDRTKLANFLYLNEGAVLLRGHAIEEATETHNEYLWAEVSRAIRERNLGALLDYSQEDPITKRQKLPEDMRLSVIRELKREAKELGGAVKKVTDGHDLRLSKVVSSFSRPAQKRPSVPAIRHCT